MQFATLVDIVVEVFLLVGHAVHGMLLRSSALLRRSHERTEYTD
jgi:hypothetical protein